MDHNYFLTNNILVKKQFNIDKVDNILEFLIILYQRLDISIIKWKNFLEYFTVEIAKNTKKNKKQGFQNVEDFLIQFYSNMDTVKEKINNNEKVILVSTQIIEAGVDLDFEKVFSKKVFSKKFFQKKFSKIRIYKFTMFIYNTYILQMYKMCI